MKITISKERSLILLLLVLFVGSMISQPVYATADPVENLEVLLNQEPLADAGEDRSVDTLQSVTLDSSLSQDPDGDTPLTYQWSQTRGNSVTLSSPSADTPNSTAPSDPEDLTFSFVVTDSLGLSSPLLSGESGMHNMNFNHNHISIGGTK